MSNIKPLSEELEYSAYLARMSLYSFVRKLSKAKRVLDWNVSEVAGIGMIAEDAEAVAAFTPSRLVAENLKKQFQGEDRLRVYSGSAANESLVPNSFDIALCNLIPDSVATWTTSIKRVRKFLSKGGILIVGLSLPASLRETEAAYDAFDVIEALKDTLHAQFEHQQHFASYLSGASLISLPSIGSGSNSGDGDGFALTEFGADLLPLNTNQSEHDRPPLMHVAICSGSEFTSVTPTVLSVRNFAPFEKIQDQNRFISLELENARVVAAQLEAECLKLKAQNIGRDEASAAMQEELDATQKLAEHHRVASFELNIERLNLRRALLVIVDEYEALKSEAARSRDAFQAARDNEAEFARTRSELAVALERGDKLADQVATHSERTRLAQEKQAELEVLIEKLLSDKATEFVTYRESLAIANARAELFESQFREIVARLSETERVSSEFRIQTLQAETDKMRLQIATHVQESVAAQARASRFESDFREAVNVLSRLRTETAEDRRRHQDEIQQLLVDRHYDVLRAHEQSTIEVAKLQERWNKLSYHLKTQRFLRTRNARMSRPIPIVSSIVFQIHRMRLMKTLAPYIHREWYLEQYEDVRQAKVDPVNHYILFGELEGRNPHPYFQTDWYFEQNPDVLASRYGAFEHFVRSGQHEGRDPSPSFSTTDYKTKHSGIDWTRTPPFAHFHGNLHVNSNSFG